MCLRDVGTMAAALRRLLQVLSVLAVVVSGTESAVIVVGGETGWTTGFDYDAWAAAQNLQIRVGDSLGESLRTVPFFANGPFEKKREIILEPTCFRNFQCRHS